MTLCYWLRKKRCYGGRIDELIETGGCCGMEMNVEKNKHNEIFKTTVHSKNYDRPKITRECGILNIWVAF